MGHAHHMSEEYSRSNYCGRSPNFRSIHKRSPSRSCSWSIIPIKSLSRSASRFVAAYHITDVDVEHKSLYTSTKRILYGEETENFQYRWIKEMLHPKPNMAHWGCVNGYGSWYKRKPHTYSNADFISPQRNTDPACTVHFTPPDWDKRELKDNNFLLKYNREKRTSIELNFFWEHKKAECCINNSKRESRKGYVRNGRKRGKWRLYQKNVIVAMCKMK